MIILKSKNITFKILNGTKRDSQMQPTERWHHFGEKMV